MPAGTSSSCRCTTTCSAAAAWQPTVRLRLRRPRPAGTCSRCTPAAAGAGRVAVPGRRNRAAVRPRRRGPRRRPADSVRRPARPWPGCSGCAAAGHRSPAGHPALRPAGYQHGRIRAWPGTCTCWAARSTWTHRADGSRHASSTSSVRLRQPGARRWPSRSRSTRRPAQRHLHARRTLREKLPQLRPSSTALRRLGRGLHRRDVPRDRHPLAPVLIPRAPVSACGGLGVPRARRAAGRARLTASGGPAVRSAEVGRASGPGRGPRSGAVRRVDGRPHCALALSVEIRRRPVAPEPLRCPGSAADQSLGCRCRAPRP